MAPESIIMLLSDWLKNCCVFWILLDLLTSIEIFGFFLIFMNFCEFWCDNIAIDCCDMAGNVAFCCMEFSKNFDRLQKCCMLHFELQDRIQIAKMIA